MSIFTKPIDQITYEDVVEFCLTGQAEGTFWEYKEDFPSENEKLAKTIAAFANTQGGLLLIGVNEKDGKPEPPFEGLQYRAKLYEKVENIILGHIRPPVSYEIQIAPNQGQSKVFIVIRTPESNDAHILNKDRAVYVRTGRSSHPEEVASSEQVEWLMDRRKKSVELREQIRFKAEERFLNACSLHSIGKEGLKGLCSVSIIPLYPQKPLVKYQEIPEVAGKIRTSSNFFSDSFPSPIWNAKKVQGGISYFEVNESRLDSVHFWELDHFGLFLYKMGVGREMPGPSFARAKNEKILEINSIVVLVCLFLKVALNFYRELGYWGLLEFRFQVENILNLRPYRYEWSTQLQAPVTDNNLNVSKDFNFKELEDNLKNIIIGILHEIFWSMHIGIEEGHIEQLILKLEPNLLKRVEV